MSAGTGRRYLITGGAGFIGSNFVHLVYRKEPDARVRVLDKLGYSASLANLEPFEGRPGFEFVRGDICDPAAVGPAMEGVTVAINFAAEVAVDRSIDDPESFLRTDIFGVYHLLEAARRQRDFERFIQISTDEVYGQILEGSFTERSELKPRNPYSASKAGGERLAYSFYETYGLPVVISRASNTYGPRAYPEKVTPLFITNLIDDLPVPVYGDGLQVRDWLYVEDHCEGVHHLVEHGENGEVYNIGGGQECTNLELTHAILERMGKDESSITYVQDRPGHDLRYSLSSDKLKALGWEPQHDLERGLDATIAWYRENEAWWRPIKEQMDSKYVSGYWGAKT